MVSCEVAGRTGQLAGTNCNSLLPFWKLSTMNFQINCPVMTMCHLLYLCSLHSLIYLLGVHKYEQQMIGILLYFLKQLMFIFSHNLPTIAGVSWAGNTREWERVNER
jgi:hypothetical protein